MVWDTAFAFKSLTPVPLTYSALADFPKGRGNLLKSDFLKRKYLIFPTIFCGLLIKYKPIILNANAVLSFVLLSLLLRFSFERIGDAGIKPKGTREQVDKWN